MADPAPLHNRPKRPRSQTPSKSPSTSIPPTPANTRQAVRLEHTETSSSAAQDVTPPLTQSQKAEVFDRLVESHPASRTTILAILPSISKIQPATLAVENPDLNFFKQSVDWCRYFLGNENWSKHATVQGTHSCRMVAEVVTFEIKSILKRTREIKLPKTWGRIEYVHKGGGDKYHDAAVAILDIGLMMFERQERLAKTNHSLESPCACACISCSDSCLGKGDACDVSLVFPALSAAMKHLSLWHSDRIYGEENAEDPEAWLEEVCHATSDGSHNPARSIVSEYVDMPTLVHSGSDVYIYSWLRDTIGNIIVALGQAVMPERNSRSALRVSRMLAATWGPVNPEKE